ncbi:hypothetical protein GMLC_32440 [Geomonas limicola]|uniref:N-acetyltransferase domain-containing protein n=1 Tax=Geomonas limicola TaxID=2740186 RepID=A0A6V8NAL5_9BACT|nr:hypothetical protein [Geomonas limicola]GFO69665.1 hypothetical protein GMLC_32440 [Geomonas limicola]
MTKTARVDNWQILRELGPFNSLKLLGSRVLSLDHYFVLRKNLMAAEPEAPALGAKFTLEPIAPCDVQSILDSLESLTAAEKRDVLGYLHFYQSGFKNCFVMRRDGQVAYMQTLIYPEQNDLIAKKYRTKFYPLKESQVMVENVFTFVPFRGLGCLQAGTGKLLDLARSQGYRSAVCYIRKDRIVSLNEFIKMGFKITRMMPEYKVLGRVWRDL